MLLVHGSSPARPAHPNIGFPRGQIALSTPESQMSWEKQSQVNFSLSIIVPGGLGGAVESVCVFRGWGYLQIIGLQTVELTS